MSSYLILQNGTEFLINFGGYSKKPVVVGFDEGELEELLALFPDDEVLFNGKEMPYREAKEVLDRLGGIVAYIPNPEDWLRACNLL